MERYSEAAWERARAREITWWQAAEIIGVSDRSMRRWRERYEKYGYDGLFDRRPSRATPLCDSRGGTWVASSPPNTSGW